ncbi:unnamed protein product [Tilletia controversa]|nr:unnamed protein product [Tilletia controversa]
MLGTQLPSLASWTSRLHHARAPTPAAGTCSTSSSLPFQSSNRVAEAGSATGQAGPSSGIIPFQNYTGRSRDGDERQLPSISSILPPLRNSQIHSVRSLNLRSTPNTHHTALLSLATHSHSRHLPEGYNQSTKESKGKQAPNEEAHELEKRKKGAAGQQSDGGQMRSLFGLATADMQRSASDAGPSKESEISSDEGDASADCIPVHHSAVKTKQPVVSNGLFLFLVTVILKGLHLGAPMLGSPWASSSSKLTTSSDIRSSGNNISQQLLPFMAQTSPTASVIGPAST